jgi:hypothetical protein
VKLNARCNAADALRAVSADLAQVFAQKPELRVYVEKLAGTFNWRKIAGTDLLSNHSFGTAIDLNVDKAAYWRWQPPAQLATFSRKNWPNEIVEGFERHGFIWGANGGISTRCISNIGPKSLHARGRIQLPAREQKSSTR